MAQLAGLAQAGTLRRPISPQQPMWLIHIDTWNYADPQKIISLIPADIRPFVVMNISLSISHDETTSQFQVAEYGYEVAKSWLRACAENQIWAMVQPSSGGYSQFSDLDLSVYEEFYRDYPNLIGFNYSEQFWGFDSTTDPLSAKWADRINHFTDLLALSKRHGGYLVVSWCGNQYSPNINPIGMLKRVPAFAAACRDYTENYILCEKYTQHSYQFDMESLCLGAYLSGYSGNYGIRYDQSGWSDATGADNTNFTLATQGAPFLEHVMLTGQTVIDGPELIWAQCFRELSAASTTDGYTMRRWDTFAQFDNVSVDLFRKVLDGTVRIPTRREVIDRTKVAIIDNVNSGGADTVYSSPDTLFEGLYRMDGDGNLSTNKSFFKKTGRYPTIPTVFALDDSDAQSLPVQVGRSAYSTRWPTIAAKVAEFDGLFPQEYTGDIYAGRHENGWVVYNPYKTGQTASGSIPFKYNTCTGMDLTLSQYTAGVVKEYANSVTYYLSNYDNVLNTALKTDTITIYGATVEPTWSYADRGSHQASVLAKTWTSGVFTLTVQHNGPLDITVNCAGSATGRLTAYTPATVIAPARPPVFAGIRQYEAECFDYKNIGGITKSGSAGSIRNYTGQGYLQFGTLATSAVRDTVTVPATGTYRLETRYAVTGADISSVDLYVNGAKVATPTFTQTPTLSDWAVLKQSVTLRAGANTVEYRANAALSAALYFDNIVVVPTAFTQGTVIQENEDGFLQVDGAIATTQPGYTGTGYADTTDAAGASIRWKVDSPFATTAAFTFRYASTDDRSAALYINGVNIVPGVRFPSTGSLSTWALVTVHAVVEAGPSAVRLQSVSASGLPNIDFLGVGGAETTGTLAPVADTYVRDGGSAGTNFGTSTQLATKNDGTTNSGFNRVTYLKFNVNGLATAQNAKLKLVPFQVDGAATLSYESIASDTWTETGMTWSNRPTAAGTLVTSLTGYTVGKQIEADVTDAVKPEAGGDGVLSLRISNGGANFIGFHSRESTTPAFRPALEYTFSSITPDSSPLTLHLRLDDGAGTTAVDSSGRDLNGTLVNASTWVTGSDAKLNGALKLTGGHVTLPAGVVSGLDDCTVAFWVKLDSIGTWARVFDFNNGTTSSSMYFVPKTSGGLIRFGLSGQILEAPATVQFTTGVWTHVAITLSGNTTTMYLDGTAVATTTTMTNNPSGLGLTPNNFIGKSASSSDPTLRGTIDDFRIYDIPLSASDIAAMASPGSPTVSSLNRTNSTPSNSSTVSWTLTFGSATTGVTAANFSLSGTATSGASIGTPTTVNSGFTWTIPVTTGLGSGTLQLDLANATGLSQAITTSLPFSGQAYTMDKTPPLITSGATASGTYRTASFSYTITASGSATTYDASGIPSGLAVNSSSGAIAGTPTQTGTFNATLTATDAVGNQGSAPLTITINAAPVTVTGLTASDKSYDGGTGASLNVSGAALSGVFVGDTVTLVTGSATGSFATATVGTGKIVTISGLTLGGADAGNYILSQPTAAAAITPVQLTVAADAKSRVFGAANPALTATITGFVNGETQSVLSGAADLTTSADATSSPGGYTITAAPGTLSATNYTFTFVNGTLTVTASTYADWKAEHFAPADQGNDAISGPEADPDGDGITNLLEYALGGDPLQSDRSILPAVNVSGGNLLFTFLRPDVPESALRLTVQSSSDLAAWTDHTIGATSGTSNGATITVEENGTAPDSITVLIPLDGVSRKFVRLRVDGD